MARDLYFTAFWILYCGISYWILKSSFSVKSEIWKQNVETGLPWWLRWYRIHLQFRRPEFDPWVMKIWRRKWLPTPVVLPGKSHGQRGLTGYSPWGHKELDPSDWLTLSLYKVKTLKRRFVGWEVCSGKSR